MSENKHPKEKLRDEALRTLDRVNAESETVAGSTFVRMADRALWFIEAHKPVK